MKEGYNGLLKIFFERLVKIKFGKEKIFIWKLGCTTD